jgi:uncharacterized protein YkwD
MLSKSFRSLARSPRFLGLLGALLVSLPLGAAPSTAAASNAGSYRVLLPMIMSAPSANTATSGATNPLESQVVALTNELRQQHGCPALRISPELSIAARRHTQEMADNNYVAHVDLSGHRSDWRAQQAGYTGIAGWENVTAGYPTAEEAVGSWYNETPPNDGHRRNMLNCALTQIGVGYATNPNSDYGTYWTQDFGQ